MCRFDIRQIEALAYRIVLRQDKKKRSTLDGDVTVKSEMNKANNELNSYYCSNPFP